METVQDDPRDRVDHGGVARDGDHVARRLDGFLLGLATHAAAEGPGLALIEPPQVGEDASGDGLEPACELRVGAPGILDRALEDPLRLTAEPGGHVSRHLVEPDVALALLLGVVEGEAVQEAPDQLPRDPRERELEGRMLVHRMVSTLVGQRSDVPALTLRDLLGVDHTGRVARARRCDGIIVRPFEPVAEPDLRARVEDGQGSLRRRRPYSGRRPHSRQRRPRGCPIFSPHWAVRAILERARLEHAQTVQRSFPVRIRWSGRPPCLRAMLRLSWHADCAFALAVRYTLTSKPAGAHL
jgi:hypothetical protein